MPALPFLTVQGDRSASTYADVYSNGENSPYFPLWSYESPAVVRRKVSVAHSSWRLEVNPVGLRSVAYSSSLVTGFFMGVSCHTTVLGIVRRLRIPSKWRSNGRYRKPRKLDKYRTKRFLTQC